MKNDSSPFQLDGAITEEYEQILDKCFKKQDVDRSNAYFVKIVFKQI